MIVNNPDRSAYVLLRYLDSFGLPHHARVIYRGRNIVAEVDGMCVKSFGVPGLIKGYIYGLFRQPKARRAYENALRLRELGVDTPVPAGYVVHVAGGRLRESYYVCDMLEGYKELRGIENLREFDSIVPALAEFMYGLHRKGIFFKDFTQGNVLYKKVDGKYRFALVDINRMEFDVNDRRKLYSNFGSTLDTEIGQSVLARCYASLAGDASLADELIDIYRRRQARLWRKRRFKERFLKRKK